MKKRISFSLIALFVAILMQAQCYPVDVVKLNAAYQALTIDPNSLKRQQEFFNAFPSTWMEYILTYQYPYEKNDKTMYHNAFKHVDALKNLTLIPDSTYCEKLVNLAVGGKWNADAPNYLQMLLSETMENKRDAMFNVLSVPDFLLKGERLQFWQFYWANIVCDDISKKKYQQLIAFAEKSYPEEVEFISTAFKYFHNGVSIPNDYPHLNPGVSIRFQVNGDKKTEPVSKMPPLSAQASENIQTWKKKIVKTYPSKHLSAKNFERYDLQIVLQKKFSLGYIGTNYQRMYITFEKIQRKSADEYAVEGFSQVKNNICTFVGAIKNIEYNQLYTFDYGVDDEAKDIVINQGYLLADFVLYENEAQQGSGIFRGLMKALWYIDTNGVLHYDDWDCSDGSSNNQYYGEWTSYKTKMAKPAAWGDWRIPMCDDLDCGEGDFFPNFKYWANGWEEYKK